MLICLPDILDRAQLAAVLEVAGRSEGFADGGATAGFRARRVKHNLQLPKAAPDAVRAGAIVAEALEADRTFQRAVLPKAVLPPLFSRYEPGMGYGPHTDDAISRQPRLRLDVAVTVFLSDPASYEGGELVIVTPLGDQEVKLRQGEAVAYPASSLHRVEPVTAGIRLACVTWVQSLVRDAAAREILYDLWRVCQHLDAQAPEGEETNLAFKSYSNLVRRWAEP